MHYKTLATVLCLTLAMMAQGQNKQTFPFAQRGDRTLYLDVYTPTAPRADSACVISVFGGGFISGERDNELQQSIARELTDRGFTVVSIDYRLGLLDSAKVAENGTLLKMTALFQYCIDIATEDCSESVAWVVAHADKLGINPDRIVLTGSSAGAITVLETDYCRANNLPQAAALPKGWRPVAVVPYSGAILCRASKLHYATPPAPTMFLHGTKDEIVAYKRFPKVFSPTLSGSARIFKEFKRKGYPAWIIRFEGIGHEVASFLPASADLFCGYVDQVLTGRNTTLDATMHDSKLVPTRWTKMNVFDLYKK